ncbi:hypothetical protein [Flavobacterium sp. DSR3-2]|uniref:hypothetical protein n=1 Tax=Flavobacterium sp. DSR3-2 TaxID=2804634 RepID=UPI003CE9508B
MEDFNELEWINNFFDNTIDLQGQGIERIKNFALFWNMFENFACGNFANVQKIESFVVNLNDRTAISNELVNPYLKYFIDRYSQNGEINIEGLQFRTFASDIRAKEKIRKVLIREVTTPQEILEALLLILLRFRNNLFHGNKQIVNLNSQISNFTHANKLLGEVLTLMKQNYLITF